MPHAPDPTHPFLSPPAPTAGAASFRSISATNTPSAPDAAAEIPVPAASPPSTQRSAWDVPHEPSAPVPFAEWEPSLAQPRTVPSSPFSSPYVLLGLGLFLLAGLLLFVQLLLSVSLPNPLASFGESQRMDRTLIQALLDPEDIGSSWVGRRASSVSNVRQGPIVPCTGERLFAGSEVDAWSGRTLSPPRSYQYVRQTILKTDPETAGAALSAARSGITCSEDELPLGIIDVLQGVSVLDGMEFGDETLVWQAVLTDDPTWSDSVTNSVLVRRGGYVVCIEHTMYGPDRDIALTAWIVELALSKMESLAPANAVAHLR